jgi:hypothetical protein
VFGFSGADTQWFIGTTLVIAGKELGLNNEMCGRFVIAGTFIISLFSKRVAGMPQFINLAGATVASWPSSVTS